MRPRILGFVILFGGLTACTVDSTITRGADGSPEWERRLHAAVVVGMASDSGQAILEQNGFTCLHSTAQESLSCTKLSGGKFDVVRRRWLALLESKQGRVATV